LELELSTIPLYLSALYSIVPGTNQEATTFLRTIVTQEMVHMLLVCNLLKSLGVRPLIASSDKIHTFPTKLPGSVLPNLTLDLGFLC
jgi:ferritin